MYPARDEEEDAVNAQRRAFCGRVCWEEHLICGLTDSVLQRESSSCDVPRATCRVRGLVRGLVRAVDGRAADGRWTRRRKAARLDDAVALSDEWTETFLRHDAFPKRKGGTEKEGRRNPHEGGGPMGGVRGG